MNQQPSPSHPNSRPNLRHPGVLLATWFGSGYLPKAPGTWGSLAALPFAWIMVQMWGVWVLAIASGVVFVIGLWAAKDYMDRSGVHDPGPVVIDEVAGQWMVLLLAPLDPVYYLISFVLFRLFDIFKPWPISWADKSLAGAWGVMLDDIFAGLFGLACLYAILRFGSPIMEGLL
ncbi:MAG: phosphatidylglycerophosphatase A [Magnetovibrio sp.]|nr:phosphatidylglycerophosphatase A [Magnetovibrio sp.]